jgi:hypothetical protein
MWIYTQATGWLSKSGKNLYRGYSGSPEGKNNPQMEDRHNVGPIPTGKYSIGQPHDTSTHGPYVLSLTPDPKNIMFGRAGFLIHGDSIANPGTASQGCIILPKAARELIYQSGDHDLEVVSGVDS